MSFNIRKSVRQASVNSKSTKPISATRRKGSKLPWRKYSYSCLAPASWMKKRVSNDGGYSQFLTQHFIPFGQCFLKQMFDSGFRFGIYDLPRIKAVGEEL